MCAYTPHGEGKLLSPYSDPGRDHIGRDSDPGPDHIGRDSDPGPDHIGRDSDPGPDHIGRGSSLGYSTSCVNKSSLSEQIYV